MKIIEQTRPLHVVGIALRTSNDEAFSTIPPHWKRFTEEGVLARIPNKASDEVIAVYTHLEHEGIDNRGMYTLIIGAPVDGLREVPAGMASAVVPASRRAVFPVERARPDLVGPAWQHIWQQHDLKKTFIADYERYGADGSIDIHIGIEQG
jgi:predicted transcriptional regulator YdeE